MKKLLSVFLILAVGLFMFTACNPESKLTDETVSVKLVTGSETRALSASADMSGLTWKYTAIKNDNGLKTGETSDQVVLTDGKTKALSQGYWNFTLYGYFDANCKELVCEGSAINQLITMDSNTVVVKVTPKQTANVNGYIKVNGDVEISDGTTDYSKGAGNYEYTKYVTIYSLSDNSTWSPITDKTNVKLTNDETFTVNSGTYKVEIKFVKEADSKTTYEEQNVVYTATTGVKYVNVYDYLTTVIKGTITEYTNAAELKPADIKVDADGSYVTQLTKAVAYSGEGTKTNSDAVEFNLPVSAAGVAETTTDAGGASTTTNNTVMKFPANSLVQSSTSEESSDKTNVSLEFVTKDLTQDNNTKVEESEEASTYQIKGINGTAVATLSFKLTGATLDSNLSNADEESKAKAPSGYTTIAAGLADSFDVANGDKATLEIGYLPGSSSTPDYSESATQTPELLSYDSETGRLGYRVYHFSTYVIFAQEYVATDGSGKRYTTLQDAADNVAEGGTITLWKDVGDEDNWDNTIHLETDNVVLNLGNNTIYGTLDLNDDSYKAPERKIVVNGKTSENYNIDGKIVNYDDGGFKNFAAVQIWNPSVMINGGVYIHNNASVWVQIQGRYNDLTTLTINNGTFIAVDYASCLANIAGKTVIKDGLFTAEKDGDIFYIGRGSGDIESKVSVEGGTFKSEGALITLETNPSSYNKKRGEIEIFDGTFEYSGELVRWDNGTPENIEASDYVKIYGGTFSTDPSAYLANEEGETPAYKVVKNNDNTYSVISEARVGDTYYANFEDAVHAAVKATEEKEKIVEVLVDKIALKGAHRPEVNGSVTINANGATFSGGENDISVYYTKINSQYCDDASETVNIIINNAKDLRVFGDGVLVGNNQTINITMNNCSLDGGKTDFGLVMLRGDDNYNKGTINVTLDTCTAGNINANGKNSAIHTNIASDVVVKNCTFTDVETAVNIVRDRLGDVAVTVEDCTFTTCGKEEKATEGYYNPIRVVNKNSNTDGKMTATIKNNTISGTKSTELGDILLVDSRSIKSSYGLTATIINNGIQELKVRDTSSGDLKTISKNETEEITVAEVKNN